MVKTLVEEKELTPYLNQFELDNTARIRYEVGNDKIKFYLMLDSKKTREDKLVASLKLTKKLKKMDLESAIKENHSCTNYKTDLDEFIKEFSWNYLRKNILGKHFDKRCKNEGFLVTTAIKTYTQAEIYDATMDLVDCYDGWL